MPSHGTLHRFSDFDYDYDNDNDNGATSIPFKKRV
jgi:hypothetical protein